MRLRPALVLLPALILLAGCAPEPAPSPTPVETSNSPSPSPSPSSSSSATPDPVETGAEFTGAELVTLCTDKTRPLAPDATYFSDMATTEYLGEKSLWFVVIPKTLDDQDTVAVCAIGGTPDAPVFELEGESLPSGVAEIRDELLAGTHDGES
ncbi:MULTISPECIES: hypothetical protein [unclassified Microbacterium]|uniref:hypothetical protein n=1 Tax=unclassified Microbacterium TaxID=2609290 RepID=UPI0016051687|nr:MULTISPECIES: hypothetical protein [unclassified Microbacterium]QNA93305.1 hypothetical protein G4G29_15030 [Microbacterium sp. Se63.02b]QYM63516.1 hypothetical protein K1X59_15075 [Microbacterium sp. Se5.02b]